MRRPSARVAAISGLAILLLGCASTPAPAPGTSGAAVQPSGKPAVGKTGASPGMAPTAATSTNLEDQIQAAVALRVHGDLAKATHALAQLVLVAPDDARVVGEYGKVLVQQGRSDDAVAFLKRAVQIKPGDWTLYSALGVAYDQMDDRKNAKVAYDRALLLHPGDPTVLNNYAVSRMLAKDYDGAQRLLMQAEAAGGTLPKIASNLQLLAQLRAANGPAPASPKPANTASGSPKSIASPSSPATAPHAMAGASGNGATTIPSAPKRATSASASSAGAEAKTTPAVIVMQRVPSDTPAAPSRRLSAQIAIDKRSTPTESIASHRTANTGPKKITPETARNIPSSSLALGQAEKNASAAPASAPTEPAGAKASFSHQAKYERPSKVADDRNAGVGRAVQTATGPHPAAALATSPKAGATNVATKRATVSAARDHTAKGVVRAAASAQAAEPTANARGKAPLPALRTADQGE